MSGDVKAVTDPYEGVRERILAATAAWADGMTLAEIRASFEAFLEGPVAGVSITPVAIGGMEGAWFEPLGGVAGRTLLYCHGGGFQIGSIRSHTNLIARLAKATGASICAFDYRLAPEHRFPAATDDAFAAYRWLLDAGIVPSGVVGDSAGGGLALTTVQRARDAGLALPASLVLLSPWLDLSMGGKSYRTLAALDVFSKPEQLQAMARTYLGRGVEPTLPLASPVLGDLAGLPPILVHAGAWDITLDDSRLLEERVREQGASITLSVFERMYHHFQVFGELPEAARSLYEIAAFLDRL